MKPAEDYERDYFREQFMLDWERRSKPKGDYKKSLTKEYNYDKRRMSKVRQDLKELKEC